MRAGTRAGLLAIALHAACMSESRGVDPSAPLPPGKASCWGAIVDIRSDRNHCGDCFRACPPYTLGCANGACVCPTAGRTLCEGQCVDLLTDSAHCGRCEFFCSEGQCVAGVCACARGTFCNGRCVDTRTDARNCGGCGVYCPYYALGCVAGACQCPPDRATVCGDACVDARRDARHCGACGHACGGGTRCAGGVCLGDPRAPAAGDRLGTRRPTFRWGGGEAMVDVCADRACATVLASFTGPAERGAIPPRDFAPGVYFWRLRTPTATPAEGVLGGAFRIDRRATTTSGLLPPGPDLDGDGVDDVVASARSAVTVYFGARTPLGARPDETLALGTFSEGPNLAFVGDFFGDTRAWLIVWLRASSTLVKAEHSAEGIVFSPISGLPYATPVFDLNDDHIGDWVYAPPDGPATFLFGEPLGSGALTRSASILVSPSIERAAPAGDVNGDGRPDVLLATSLPTPRAWVGLGSSAGVDRFLPLPPAPRSAGFGASLSCAGDVNGDGFADALVALGATGAAVYLGGREALTLQRVIDAPVGAEILVGAAGDVDGDGFGDVIAVPRARGEAWLFRGGASGLPATPIVLPDGRWRNVEALGLPGDRNGDGLDDVVAGAPTEAAVHVFYGAGSGPFSRVETRRGEPGSDAGRHVL